MWFSVAISILLLGNVLSEEIESRVVITQQGSVRGYKDSNEDIFVFYGIPYAKAPTGTQRFKAPLPPPKWSETLDAVNQDIICPQVRAYEFIPKTKTMQEDCLIASVYVPDTSEKNLPVAVYVHGGGFIIGHGNMITPKKLVNSKKIIAVTFNYRLGAHGFLCFGTEDIPGNAGMKDQVALLRWVKQNIESFGGNPQDVTIAGQSAGAASVALLMVSKMAKGLFSKVIPESGDTLSPFSVQLNPIHNAQEYAKLIDFADSRDITDLENFYKNAPYERLQSGNVLHRTENVFLLAPCVERDIGQDRFFEDDPFSTLVKGDFENVPILHGFDNMEGLLRIDIFEHWKEKMNTNFEDFLPPDLQFSNDEEMYNIAKQVKSFYFNDDPVSNDSILSYINYFTDTMFACPTLRTIQYLLKAGNDQVYLYDYSYVDDTVPTVPHTKVRGANHCAQSLALFDGINITHVDESDISPDLKNWKNTMRGVWLNFITTGKPEHSDLPKWLPVDGYGSPYMDLKEGPELKESLLKDRCLFWEEIYNKYYRRPIPPSPVTPGRVEL